MNLQQKQFFWYKAIGIILFLQSVFLLFSIGQEADNILLIIFIPLSIISALCYSWVGWKQKVTNNLLMLSSLLFGIAFFMVLIPWLIEGIFNRTNENFLVVIFMWPLFNIIAFLILMGGFLGLHDQQKGQRQGTTPLRKNNSKRKRNKIL
ncbi:MAG: hypothetical protein Q7K45_02625 [Nanoarchaeota archaeon]|nr:hypothetical protein [Nanoarchaeota archaeon]